MEAIHLVAIIPIAIGAALLYYYSTISAPRLNNSVPEQLRLLRSAILTSAWIIFLGMVMISLIIAMNSDS